MTRGIPLSALIMCGCAVYPFCTSDPRSFTNTDEWYDPVADGPPTQPLPQDSVIRVSPSQLDAAAAMLEEVAIVPLDLATAASLVDRELDPVPGAEPYLVRGVILGEGGGHLSAEAFTNETGERAIVVSYFALGQCAQSMSKQPVVVFLTHEPQRVYVDVSLAA